MKIINLSNSVRCGIAEEILSSREFKNNAIRRIILLPIPSFRDGEHVSGTDVTMDEVLSQARGGDLVAGYGLSGEFCSRALALGAVTLDLECDNGFIFRNNELTAHATLPYILSEGGRDVSELSVGVIGYGRLGAVLSRLLLFLGARLTVFSGSEEKREALSREGITCLNYGEIGDSKTDILINTAPARYLTDGCPLASLFLDLASGNLYAEFGAKFLPSLPEKHYPVSAGKAYAKAVIDYCNLH